MGKGKWRLKVKKDFSAAHQLRNYCGKCEHLHGHNFGVEVEVEGDRLDDKVEILMDFKELKKELDEILKDLDHKNLSEVEFFKEKNPSSENLAFYIYRRLAERLAGREVTLVSASVSEKESSVATYSEI